MIYFHDVEKKRDFIFSSKFSCPVSGFTIEEIEPRLFSFNSPNGACPNCDGLGYIEKFDPALIIGNSELSVSEGVILPWNKSNSFYTELIMKFVIFIQLIPIKNGKIYQKNKRN